MRYRYLDDFRRGISVFAIFSYGIAVLGTPQCPPQLVKLSSPPLQFTFNKKKVKSFEKVKLVYLRMLVR